MARAGGKDRGLFERPKGSDIWWVRYTDTNGVEHREKAGMKRAAQTLYKTRKREAREGTFVLRKTKKILVKELIADALVRSKARKGDKSWLQDDSKGEVFKQLIGDLPADSLKPREVEQLLETYRTENQLSPATSNRYRAFLSMVFSLGVRAQKISSNPVRLTEKLPENPGRVRFLSKEEETALLATIEAPSQRIEVLFALHTGVRQAAQFNLRWDEIQDGVAYFPHTKNGSEQYVHLNTLLLGYLSSIPRTGDWVFPDSRAELLVNKRLNWFNNALKAAGIVDFHWHDLRHSFATRLAMRGHSMRTLQVALGHKSPQMTMRYAHLSDSHMKDALEGLV